MSGNSPPRTRRVKQFTSHNKQRQQQQTDDLTDSQNNTQTTPTAATSLSASESNYERRSQGAGRGSNESPNQKKKTNIDKISNSTNNRAVFNGTRIELAKSKSTSQDGDGVMCVVCAEDIVNYAVVTCSQSHPVCSKCILRLRFLQKDNRCPVCRSEITWVLFAPHLVSDWTYSSFVTEDKDEELDLLRQLREKYFKVDELLKTVFHSKSNYEEFCYLTTIECKVCKKVVRTDEELKTHLRKMHEMKLCDICLVHLNRFPTEYVYYDRSQLAVHNKTGDKETLGQKGHPLCEFCQKRFLDGDELEAHQRREHYYCHFCADQGFVEFFPDPYFLKRHYQKFHILCEEGDCANDYGFFTSVFNNDVDYQAHRLREHGKSYTKKIRDQLKQIPFAFETPYSRSGNNSNNNNQSDSRQHSGRGQRGRGGDGAAGNGGQFDLESYYGDNSRSHQQNGGSHNRQNPNQRSTNNTQQRTRYGRDRRMPEDGGYANGPFDFNSHVMACSPPKIDSSIAPSERGFFEVPHRPPRAEGLPLSEQHKLTTTIATEVPKQHTNNHTNSHSNNYSALNGNHDGATNNADGQINGSSGMEDKPEDFPDLPNTSSKSTSFWSGFDTTTMKGIDRLQETHFPALPQSDNPIKKSKMKKGNNITLQPNKNQLNSAWGGTTSSSSNPLQPQNKVEVVKNSPKMMHKVESSPAMLQQSHQQNALMGSVQVANSVWGDQSPSLQDSVASVHPSYMVVRPKTKSGKKKKKKNDPDETVSSIKSILSSVNSELAEEDHKNTDMATEPSQNGWRSFENDDVSKSQQASTGTVDQGSCEQNPNQQVSVNNNGHNDISFNGLTLTEIEERPKRTPNSDVPPPGFEDHNLANGDTGGVMRTKEPLLELPPGFEPPPQQTKAVDGNSSKVEQVSKNASGKSNSKSEESKKAPLKEYDYFYPDDFDLRNRQLNAMIHQLLVNRTTGDEKMYHDFLKISKSFSRNQGSANAVLNFCRYNLGDSFNLVFTEVLCLLPNISSQRKLLSAFNRQNGSFRDTNSIAFDEKVTSCEVCLQVLAHKDRDLHMKKAHDDENSSTELNTSSVNNDNRGALKVTRDQFVK